MNEIETFDEKTRSKTFWQKEIKEITLDNMNNFYEARETILNGFKNKIFLTESTGTGLKILAPKQMLQRLPIALAQVKAHNNSETAKHNK